MPKVTRTVTRTTLKKSREDSTLFVCTENLTKVFLVIGTSDQRQNLQNLHFDNTRQLVNTKFPISAHFSTFQHISAHFSTLCSHGGIAQTTYHDFLFRVFRPGCVLTCARNSHVYGRSHRTAARCQLQHHRVRACESRMCRSGYLIFVPRKLSSSINPPSL